MTVSIPLQRLVLSLALALIVGCDPGGGSARGNAVEQVLDLCPGFAETGKPPLVSGARCGTLPVPLDPNDPDGEQISLNVLLLPAIAPAPEPDPLFVLVGGPGQAAVEQAETLLHFFGDIRRSRDLVFVDQRGTGQSAPLACDLDELRSPGLDLLLDLAPWLEALADCAAALEHPATLFTTVQAADDLDWVRRALGYDKINLWGISYGTRLATEMLRRHGDSVRSVVLDGAAPVALALPWHSGEDAGRALELLHEHCTADAWCAGTQGPLLPRAEAVVRRLAGEPVSVTLAHPRSGRETQVQLSDQAFVGLLRMVLYSRELSRMLPVAVARAYEGDYSTLAVLWLLAEGQQAQLGINLALHYSVVCAEDFSLVRQLGLEQSQPLLGLELTDVFTQICDFWPVVPMAEEYYRPVTSPVPALLLSGDLDPVTPPRWGEQMAAGLDNGLHLVAPGAHHGVTYHGCARRLIERFVDAGHHRDLDTTCIQAIAPLPPLRDMGTEPEDAAP